MASKSALNHGRVLVGSILSTSPFRTCWTGIPKSRHAAQQVLRARQTSQLIAKSSSTEIQRVQDWAADLEWKRDVAGDIVFACDDSDKSELAAKWALANLVRPGDKIHFVHVVSDERAQATALGDSKSCSYYDSMEEEHDHGEALRAKGKEVVQRRFLGHAKMANVDSQVHVPVLKGAESAADIGGVLCQLSADLHAWTLVVVSPHRGVFSDFGSVGHYCYEHAKVPITLIPPMPSESFDMMEDKIVVVAQDEYEMMGCRNWVMNNFFSEGDHLTMVHVWDAQKASGTIFPACLFSQYDVASVRCDEESTMKSEVAEYLCRRSNELHPKLVIMYSQAQQGLIESMKDPGFTVEYCSKAQWPVLLLPRSKQDWEFTSEGEEYLSRWTDHSEVVNA